MKLAEALVERKSLKDRLDRLRHRLQANAKVQEGDKPSEEPEELLSEIDRILMSLESLTVRINKTNIAEVLEGGTSIMEAIIRRDMLGLRRNILEELASSATVTRDRFSRSEIKFEPTVDVGEIRKRIDAVAKEYRELDTKLQAEIGTWISETKCRPQLYLTGQGWRGSLRASPGSEVLYQTSLLSCQQGVLFN